MSADTLPSAPAPAWPRSFYWSVRRELWEHRSVYLAPFGVGALTLVGFLIAAWRLPDDVRAAGVAATAKHAAEAIAAPYQFAAFITLATSLFVSALYCLGALYGERRDRSLLFWKSLPVSDLTTVLAKAAIPVVVLPALVFVVAVVTQLIVLTLSLVIVAANGLDVGVPWSHAHLPYIWSTLGAALPYFALWYAPIYAWMLLVSAWAPRVPTLWAIFPPLALALVEHLGLRTHYVFSWLILRLAGAFTPSGRVNDGTFDPASYLDPQLWLGLVVAAALLTGAVWLRRSREPI
jgi:ABC-2 type transport system permease protein